MGPRGGIRLEVLDDLTVGAYVPALHHFRSDVPTRLPLRFQVIRRGFFPYPSGYARIFGPTAWYIGETLVERIFIPIESTVFKVLAWPLIANLRFLATIRVMGSRVIRRDASNMHAGRDRSRQRMSVIKRRPDKIGDILNSGHGRW